MINIVIPIYNRIEHTKQTIESLFKNTPKHLYRLYLIDDVSTDGTREYLQNLDEDFYLQLNEKNVGPAASRNMACEFITAHNERGEFIYHSDNDVYFQPNWLEDMIKVFEIVEMKGVKLLGGGCHPYLQNNNRLDGIMGASGCVFNVGLKDAVSGYSQLMRWETWDKYGHFSDANRDAEMKIMGSEDWLYCQNIIKDGYLVGSLEPEVVIATGKTNTYGDKATGHETFKEIEGIFIE